jgi:hypothetical protein
MEVSVNLTKLKHVVRMINGNSGQPVECLIIPVKENNLYEGKEGMRGLNLKAWAVREPKTENKKTNTHILKQTVGKEAYENMTEEEKREMPIIGNIFEWEGASDAPVASEEIDQFEIDENLPF